MDGPERGRPEEGAELPARHGRAGKNLPDGGGGPAPAPARPYLLPGARSCAEAGTEPVGCAGGPEARAAPPTASTPIGRSRSGPTHRLDSHWPPPTRPRPRRRLRAGCWGARRRTLARTPCPQRWEARWPPSAEASAFNPGVKVKLRKY